MNLCLPGNGNGRGTIWPNAEKTTGVGVKRIQKHLLGAKPSGNQPIGGKSMTRGIDGTKRTASASLPNEKPGRKNCSNKKCKSENPQPLANFGNRTYHYKGEKKVSLQGKCRNCINIYSRDYNKRTGKRTEASTNWRRRNPEKWAKVNRSNVSDFHKRNPEWWKEYNRKYAKVRKLRYQQKKAQKLKEES